MDPARPSVAQELLRLRGLRPRKGLGQHFLCDGNVLDRIADLAVPQPGCPVLEIGAGLGALTLRLARLGGRVTAVEVDPALVPLLKDVLASEPDVTIVQADFLALDTRETLRQAFGGRTGVVAGNIPYNITTPILERVFESADLLQRAVILMQLEVAERLTAMPGTREYGALTLFAAYHGTIRRAFRVSRNVFIPPPDVDSAVVVFEPTGGVGDMVVSREAFFSVVRAAFAQRRKTLANALVAAKLAPDRESARRPQASRHSGHAPYRNTSWRSVRKPGGVEPRTSRAHPGSSYNLSHTRQWK